MRTIGIKATINNVRDGSGSRPAEITGMDMAALHRVYGCVLMYLTALDLTRAPVRKPRRLATVAVAA